MFSHILLVGCPVNYVNLGLGEVWPGEATPRGFCTGSPADLNESKG